MAEFTKQTLMFQLMALIKNRVYKLTAVDCPEFTDRMWREYFRVLGRMSRKNKTPFTVTSWQKLKKQRLSMLELDKDANEYVIFRRARIVGWVGFAVRDRKTPHSWGITRFNTLVEPIDALLCRTLACHLYDLMIQNGLDRVHVTTLEKHTNNVVRKWRAERIGPFHQYSLDRKKADYPVIEQWLKSIPRQNKNLRLRFYRRIPDRHLGKFSRLLTQSVRDMPEERHSGIRFRAVASEIRRTERWRTMNEIPTYKLLLFDPKDRLVGLTVAEVNLNNPQDILQAMTGIGRKYRGKGLARWLKAAMFVKLGKLFPTNERIYTWMRAVNAPIQHINGRMGYILDQEGYEYKLLRKHLTDFLGM
jgi:hypothetical protein